MSCRHDHDAGYEAGIPFFFRKTRHGRVVLQRPVFIGVRPIVLHPVRHNVRSFFRPGRSSWTRLRLSREAIHAGASHHRARTPGRSGRRPLATNRLPFIAPHDAPAIDTRRDAAAVIVGAVPLDAILPAFSRSDLSAPSSPIIEVRGC